VVGAHRAGLHGFLVSSLDFTHMKTFIVYAHANVYVPARVLDRYRSASRLAICREGFNLSLV